MPPSSSSLLIELLVGDIGGAGTIFDSFDDDVSLKISKKKCKPIFNYFHEKKSSSNCNHLPDDEVNGGCFCSLLVVASILDWSSSLEMVELHSEATVRLDSGRPVKTEKIINQKLL